MDRLAASRLDLRAREPRVPGAQDQQRPTPLIRFVTRPLPPVTSGTLALALPVPRAVPALPFVPVVPSTPAWQMPERVTAPLPALAPDPAPVPSTTATSATKLLTHPRVIHARRLPATPTGRQVATTITVLPRRDPVQAALDAVVRARRQLAADFRTTAQAADDTLLDALWRHGWQSDDTGEADPREGMLPALVPALAVLHPAHTGLIAPLGRVLAIGWTGDGASGFASPGQVRFSRSAWHTTLDEPRIGLLLVEALEEIGGRLAASWPRHTRWVAQEIGGVVRLVEQPHTGCGLACADCPEHDALRARAQRDAQRRQVAYMLDAGWQVLLRSPSLVG